MDKDVIAERIQSYRHAAGLTVEGLAARINELGEATGISVTEASVRNWEAARTDMQARYGPVLGLALGVDPRDIFVGTEG